MLYFRCQYCGTEVPVREGESVAGMSVGSSPSYLVTVDGVTVHRCVRLDHSTTPQEPSGTAA